MLGVLMPLSRVLLEWQVWGGARTVSREHPGRHMSSSLSESDGRGGGSLWGNVPISLPWQLSRKQAFPLRAVGSRAPRLPLPRLTGRGPLPTVRVAGRSFSPAAAAVLPVVPAVQLCLSLQLLLPCGECRWLVTRHPSPVLCGPPPGPLPSGMGCYLLFVSSCTAGKSWPAVDVWGTEIILRTSGSGI